MRVPLLLYILIVHLLRRYLYRVHHNVTPVITLPYLPLDAEHLCIMNHKGNYIRNAVTFFPGKRATTLQDADFIIICPVRQSVIRNRDRDPIDAWLHSKVTRLRLPDSRPILLKQNHHKSDVLLLALRLHRKYNVHRFVRRIYVIVPLNLGR